MVLTAAAIGLVGVAVAASATRPVGGGAPAIVGSPRTVVLGVVPDLALPARTNSDARQTSDTISRLPFFVAVGGAGALSAVRPRRGLPPTSRPAWTRQPALQRLRAPPAA